jgi:mRNA interferase MazF
MLGKAWFVSHSSAYRYKTRGDTKKRPDVVVFINVRNQLSSSVLVVPLTSDLTGGETPTRILLEAAEGVLLTDSLPLWDNISAIRQIYLEPGPYGAITSSTGN